MSFFITKFLQLKQLTTKDQQDSKMLSSPKFTGLKQSTTFLRNKENFSPSIVYGQKYDILKTYNNSIIASAKE